jgi:hypothetical protein
MASSRYGSKKRILEPSLLTNLLGLRAMKADVIYIGTSGWSYKSWAESFYPLICLLTDDPTFITVILARARDPSPSRSPAEVSRVASPFLPWLGRADVVHVFRDGRGWVLDSLQYRSCQEFALPRISGRVYSL